MRIGTARGVVGIRMKDRRTKGVDEVRDQRHETCVHGYILEYRGDLSQQMMISVRGRRGIKDRHN